MTIWIYTLQGWLHPRIRTVPLRHSQTFIPDGITLSMSEGFQKAVEHVRSGKGPVLIESVTYRYHSSSNPSKWTRRRSRWKKRFNWKPFYGLLWKRSAEDWSSKNSKGAVEASKEFQEESPFPPLESAEDIYADQGEKPINVPRYHYPCYVEEMRRDENVLLMGEDVEFRWDFGTSVECLRNSVQNETVTVLFQKRLFAAAESAMTGLRPIVDKDLHGFLSTAMDAIVNCC